MLSGRSGVGFGTTAPLRPSEIQAFAQGMDVRISPREFTALLMFDNTARVPDVRIEKEDDDDEEQEPSAGVRTPAWPQRKSMTPE